MKLNESIISIRAELQEHKLKKSGKNKFAGFEYFELSDFLPTINVFMLGKGMNDIFEITESEAKLSLVKDEEVNIYRIPFVLFDTPLNKQGGKSMQDIQYLGALITYYKRYLYMNAFGITDGEVVDAMDTQHLPQPSTGEQVSEITSLLESTQSDIVKFLQVFKVKSVGEMTEAVAAQAIKTLHLKEKKMKEAK